MVDKKTTKQCIWISCCNIYTLTKTSNTLKIERGPWNISKTNKTCVKVALSMTEVKKNTTQEVK